jgi:hypothetical protein
MPFGTGQLGWKWGNLLKYLGKGPLYETTDQCQSPRPYCYVRFTLEVILKFDFPILVALPRQLF